MALANLALKQIKPIFIVRECFHYIIMLCTHAASRWCGCKLLLLMYSSIADDAVGECASLLNPTISATIHKIMHNHAMIADTHMQEKKASK